MAKAEPNGFEGLLYRLGYASARARSALREVQEAGAGAAQRPSERSNRFADEPADAWDDDDGANSHPVAAMAAATAVGALLTQVLHPRSVNWPRAVLAGTIGTLLYDAETVVESRLRKRKFGTSRSAREALMQGGLRGQAGRYAAAIGMAGFYGQFFYGRLPGPRVLHGMLYGLAEGSTRGWGGPIALLNRVSPQIRIPSGYTHGIAHGTETTVERLGRHLLFGLALGIIYKASDED